MQGKLTAAGIDTQLRRRLARYQEEGGPPHLAHGRGAGGANTAQQRGKASCLLRSLQAGCTGFSIAGVSIFARNDV